MSQGRPPEVTDKEILNVIQTSNEPFLTTTEIAEQLPIGQRAVLNRLSKLHDQGTIKKKDLGDRYSVWWTPSSLQLSLQSQIQESRERVREYRNKSHPSFSEQRVEEKIRELDIPGTEETEDARRKAIIAAYKYLRNERKASKQDFIKKLFSSFSAGYSNERAWWEKLIRPALRKLPTVKPSSRGGAWRYQSEDIDPGIIELQTRLPDDVTELNNLLFKSWSPSQEAIKEDRHREIGKAVIKLLAQNCTLTKSELIDLLQEQHDLEMESEEVWNTIILPALERAETVGILRRNPDGHQASSAAWRWQVVPISA